jgi:hypothetical protein
MKSWETKVGREDYTVAEIWAGKVGVAVIWAGEAAGTEIWVRKAPEHDLHGVNMMCEEATWRGGA